MSNLCLKLLGLHTLNLSGRVQTNGAIRCSLRSFIVRPVTQIQPYSPFTSSDRLSEFESQYCGCFTRNRHNSLLNGSGFNSSGLLRYYTTAPEPSHEQPTPKPSLYQRIKAMYRDYWYVVIPVHLVTSACWFGGFYYLASRGVDFVALLEWLNVNEKLIKPFRNGHTGYIAISYALYKIATPLRYTVTLGGTTVSINYLKQWGYIKPVPSKEKLKEMYTDKKEQLIEKKNTLKDNMMQTLKPSESKKKNP